MDQMVINSGDTAWMLASTALVLLMTPGLAFFYGGMVGKKTKKALSVRDYLNIAENVSDLRSATQGWLLWVSHPGSGPVVVSSPGKLRFVVICL